MELRPESHELTLLFGDQNVNGDLDFPRILDVTRQSPVVNSYLHQADAALGRTIAALPRSRRKAFWPYRGLRHHMSSHLNSSDSNPLPHGLLLCVNQMMSLLFHAEQDPTILSDARSTLALGLCTGMLPAIASISSNNLARLHDVAVEMTLVSFRLECEMIERANMIEETDTSWAVVCRDISTTALQDELDSLNQSLGDVDRKVFISVKGSTSVTVSGPPSSLEALLSRMPVSRQKRCLKLPVHAPFHASHLFSPDEDLIVGKSSTLAGPIRANASVLSTSTGRIIPNSRNIAALLRVAVRDIVSCPLRLDLVSQQLEQSAVQNNLNILTFGPISSRKFITDSCPSDRITFEADLATCGNQQGASGQGKEELFAIVGMAGRFPGADSVEEFWEILENARAMHKKIPADRFDIATHVDESGNKKNTSLTPWGAFIDSAGLFDNLLFKISPKEAPRLDPMHRLLLMTCFEALESAGYQRDRTLSSHHTRIGTYYGCSSDDWRQSNSSQDIDGHFIPGANRCFGPGRLNYHFGWEGPSYSVDTACSSSAAAIQLALNGIKSGDCDTAVAGGSSVSTCSDIFAGLSRGGFLSATGACKTFLEGGDGYCRADAVASIVIKRLEAAEADNDNIMAVIRSCSSNNSAEATSLTRPHAPTQQTLFRRTLFQGGVKPSQIDYVEMHGTGTVAGDAGESSSVGSVFLNDPERQTPLYVGSIKPNVGHSEAASGVSSVIKGLLMLRHGTVPPHIIGDSKFNPNLPEGFTSLIPRTKMPLGPGSDGVRNKMILINNFNAAGGNTSLLLEEYTKTRPKSHDPRENHVVVVSANSEKSLIGNLRNLQAHVEENKDQDISDLAYSTTARRMHHGMRMAFVAESTSKLLAQLQQANMRSLNTLHSKHKGVAFAFPGQGGIYLGMGQQLYATSEVFRKSIEKSARISAQQGFVSILDCFQSKRAMKNHEQSTLRDQLVLLALEIALYDMWTSWGITPDVVLGHSLGEYAALYAAGVLSLSDTIFLVGTRAQLLQMEVAPGTDSMLVARCSTDECEAVMDARSTCACEIACVNGPCATVVSGPEAELETLQDGLSDNRIKSSKLRLPYAFHSAQMDPVLERFEAATRHVPFRKSKIAMASGMHGAVMPAGSEFDHSFLVNQMRRPVLFQQALESCRDCGLADAESLWVELGPGSACSSMIRSTLDVPSARLLNSLKESESEWLIISRSLGRAYESGLDISWPDFHQEYEEKHLTFIDLPTYSFDLKHFWMQYEGDWMITKGQVQPAPEEVAPMKQHISATLHRLVDETVDQDSLSLLFSTDPKEASLTPLFQGHTLFDRQVCSPSIYVDMAYSAVAYAERLLVNSGSVEGFEIRDMRIEEPLIIDADDPKSNISVSLSKSSYDDGYNVTFGKGDGNDDSNETAGCVVMPTNLGDRTHSWRTIAHLITSRISSLESSSTSSVSKLQRQIIYKLLSSTVNYEPSFQGLDEVFLDDSSYEGVGHVTFKTNPGEEDGYIQCPHWLESLLHVAFFVLNATCAEDMFLSTGWDTLSIAAALRADEKYTSYVKMRPGENDENVVVGDVYVLERGETIVAVCEGLRFKRFKKSSVRRMFTERASSQSSCDQTQTQTQTQTQMQAQTQLQTQTKTQEPVSQHEKPIPNPSTSDPLLVVARSSTPTRHARSRTRTLISQTPPPRLSSRQHKKANSLDDTRNNMLQPNPSLRILNNASSSLSDTRSISHASSARTLLNSPVDTPSPSSPVTVTALGDTRFPTDKVNDRDTQFPTEQKVNDRLSQLRAIIATELEVDASSISPDTSLVDMGLDSILGIAVLKMAKKNGFHLDRDFFVRLNTLGEMERELDV